MAITNINISQDNKIGESNLCPVHSPLVFLVDVTYTDETPSLLYVDVIDENSDVLETFKCIPYDDPLSNVRKFAFVANDVIKGIMNGFDDELQLNNTLQYVDDITKLLTLKFYDPDDPDDSDTFDSVTIDFVHGASQFSENPNFESIYNNEDSIYYGPDGHIVYVYFYNEDVNNILTINNPSASLENAQDYDDEVFVDYDDTIFQIDIAF